MTHTASGPLSSATYAPPAAPRHDSLHRTLGVSGLIAALSIIAGIVAVSMIPDQMVGNALEKAVGEIQANHRAEVVAGWMFAIGLAALVPFIWTLVRTIGESERLGASVGASVLTIGATINVIGGLLMVALGHTMQPMLADPAGKATGMMLVAVGLALDSMYNLSLAASLLLIGRAMRRASAWPGWLGAFAMAVGVLSIPVAFEWYSDKAALFQYASGSLFLLWTLCVSVMALRRRA